jgi:hypothetical protein
LNEQKNSDSETPKHGYLLNRIVKNTKRFIFVFVLLVGFIEYLVYQEYKAFVQTYAVNFATVAAAQADKIADGGNYCIMAPNYRDQQSWLILNDFAEIDIHTVIKQAVYFRLGLPSRVYTGVGQRVPHFALYANGKRYFWSFSTQSFYEYSIQNTGLDRYLTTVCEDMVATKVDRSKASLVYQQDPKWIKIFHLEIAKDDATDAK